jgi:hypothetical protein
MPLFDIALAIVLLGVLAWFANTRISEGAPWRTTINVVLTLVVVGVVLWAIDNYIPMAGVIRAILNIVVVFATIVWVLRAFGLWAGAVRLWHDLTGRIQHETVEAKK